MPGGIRARPDGADRPAGITPHLRQRAAVRRVPDALPGPDECARLSVRQAAGNAPAPQQVREHARSEEHTSELQSPCNLVCRLLLEKKKLTAHAVRARL